MSFFADLGSRVLRWRDEVSESELLKNKAAASPLRKLTLALRTGRDRIPSEGKIVERPVRDVAAKIVGSRRTKLPHSHTTAGQPVEREVADHLATTLKTEEPKQP